MSLAKARALAGGLKWNHLGFAFFWAAAFVSLTSPVEGFATDLALFSFFKQLVTILSCLAVAAVMRHRCWFPPNSAFAAGVMMSAGSLMYYLAFFYGEYTIAACLLSALLVGGSCGWFYVMWQSFYASEGSTRTTIYIPLSCALSSVICVMVLNLPLEWTVLLAVVALPSAAAWALHASLSEIEPYQVRPMRRADLFILVRNTWKPVFCVCVLGFVWRIVGYLAPESAGSSWVVMIAMGAAALLVAGIELLSDEGINVMRMYQYLFPLITAACLMPTFLGEASFGLVHGAIMFGFEVLNLFLLITCAIYASRQSYNSAMVYVICVCPTLLSLLLGDVVGAKIGAKGILDATLAIEVLFACVYLMAVVMFLISTGRARKRQATERAVDCALDYSPQPDTRRDEVHKGAALVADATSDEETNLPASASADDEGGRAAGASATEGPSGLAVVGSLATEPLSPRELEVLDLILKGNTVAAISKKLFISENTVRGHFKHIYRKMNVHSKQELVDLLG
ncbi:MAG: helix-turn-helix transcriptional regulator [Eggerthellales bacterium]|nr:helix-turn-helix transcriptional regulator [Eggerthellales bacterium]